MCKCEEILLREKSRQELQFMRPDRIKLVLGNGERVVFNVVFVADDHESREVTLRCATCDQKWLVRLKPKYLVQAL